MKVIEASSKVCLFTLHVRSTTAPEFVDLTDRVVEFVQQSEIQNGFAVVFSKHTTAAITIQENEPLLMADMANLLERLVPRNAHYRHNDFSVRTVNMHENERPNGHSHCQHLTLGTSETIPIVDGQLAFGQFQRVFMVELDDEAPVPEREILIQIMGV
jgi:secondary thiamine-phosphate synthase enzyme